MFFMCSGVKDQNLPKNCIARFGHVEPTPGNVLNAESWKFGRSTVQYSKRKVKLCQDFCCAGELFLNIVEAIGQSELRCT